MQCSVLLSVRPITQDWQSPVRWVLQVGPQDNNGWIWLTFSCQCNATRNYLNHIWTQYTQKLSKTLIAEETQTSPDCIWSLPHNDAIRLTYSTQHWNTFNTVSVTGQNTHRWGKTNSPELAESPQVTWLGNIYDQALLRKTYHVKWWCGCHWWLKCFGHSSESKAHHSKWTNFFSWHQTWTNPLTSWRHVNFASAKIELCMETTQTKQTTKPSEGRYRITGSERFCQTWPDTESITFCTT